MTIISRSGVAGLSPAGAVLALAGVVLPPLAVVAPLGLAPLLAVVALALLVIDWRRALGALGEFAGLAALLAALGAWGMLSAAWSILPAHSFLEGLRLLAISAAGLICLGATRALPAPERRRLGSATALGAALAVVLLLAARFVDLELFRTMLSRAPDWPLTRFDRGATVLALTFWPALAGAAPRRWLAAALAVAVGVAVLGMVSTAAKLALAVGVLLFAAAYRWPRPVAAALMAGIALIAIGLPLATPSSSEVVALHQKAAWLKPSGIHRLLIWRFTAERIAERPLFGWGMDASRDLPGGQLSLADLVPNSDLPGFAKQLPLHPHNAALQWQVELGLPGLLLCLGVIAWGLARIVHALRLSRLNRAVALAWAGGVLTIALLSFGAWQAWWLSGLWLTAALMAGIGAGGNEDSATAGSPART
jgi:exopolysaccharide production protein ExoQ